MSLDDNLNEKEKNILKKYVTNVDSNIFVLKNLQEVVKGALFSRYSRSTLGLKRLLLKDFIKEDNLSDESLENNGGEKDLLKTQKAKDFYDRVLDGFGDDSIGELGGVHLAIEEVSMIAAKAIEDVRIGGSPLEKSTRYIYFDQKVNGEYKFYKEKTLMKSEFKDLYLDTCNLLFETYSKLIPPLTKNFEEKISMQEGISDFAYKAAIRAKVLDCLRGLLPSSTFTNLGVFGNGRFFDNLLKKLSSSDLVELNEISKKSFYELDKVIPSFVKRSSPDSKSLKDFLNFSKSMKEFSKKISAEISKENINKIEKDINLISFDNSQIYDVLAALFYENSKVDFESLKTYAKSLNEEEILEIFKDLSSFRENRRHKSPRALEHAFFTFDIKADFGVYRDLQRHRMLTQQRQHLTCDHGYYIPDEILNTPLEKDYRYAMDQAKISYDAISKKYKDQSQYVVPMAYNMRWYFTINLRALQWLTELRSSAAGHPNYRIIAQEMVKKVIEKNPLYKSFFGFVDFNDYKLGRENEERRISKKKEKILN